MKELSEEKLRMVNGGSEFGDVLKEAGNALLGAAGTAASIVVGAGAAVSGNVPGAVASGAAGAASLSFMVESMYDAAEDVGLASNE
jgi:hypothetical protein